MVDGVMCTVTDATVNQIVCDLGNKPDPNFTEQLDSDSGSPIDGWIAGSGFKYERYDTS